MLIFYARETSTVAHVTIDDEDMWRVNTYTLLSITLNEYLTRQTTCIRRAASLYFAAEKDNN